MYEMFVVRKVEKTSKTPPQRTLLQNIENRYVRNCLQVLSKDTARRKEDPQYYIEGRNIKEGI